MPPSPTPTMPRGVSHARPRHLLVLALVASFASLSTSAQTTLYRCTDADGNLTIQSAPCPAGTEERKQVVNDLPSAPAETTPPKASLPEPEWQIAPSEPAPAPMPILAPVAPQPSVEQAMPQPGQPLVRPIPLETRSDGIGVDGESVSDFHLLDSGTPLAERESVADDAAAGDATDEVPKLPPLYACRTWNNDAYFGELAEPPPRCAPLETIGIGGNPGIGAGVACEMRDDTCSAVPEEQLCEGWLRRLRDEQAKLVFARSDDPAATRADVERMENMLRGSHCQ